MSQPRPKPWEISAGTGTSANANASAAGDTSMASPVTPENINNGLNTGTNGSGPSVPPIPSSISNTIGKPPSSYATANGMGATSGYGTGYNNTYGTSRHGMGGYGSSYGMGGYGNSYGMGGYGSSYGMGGLGGYGNSYGMGGYGMGSRYGMNGMGMGMGGLGMSMPGQVDVNGNPLNSFTDTTARTFQVLENVVYAISAMAALVESTFYATHNSFFTILGVADQFSQLGNVGGAIKNTISGVTDSVKQIGNVPGIATNAGSPSNSGPLGVFALLSWLKRLLKRLLGMSTKPDKYSSNNGSHALLQEFVNWKKGLKNKDAKSRGLSLKPLIVFLLALIGLPMVMSKFVRYIENEQSNRITNSGNIDNTSTDIMSSGVNRVNESNDRVDPRKLEFARAMYDYIPENEEMQANGWKEMKVVRGDLVAILTTIDGWSHCRSRDGRVGYVPTNYLEIIKRGEKAIAISSEGSQSSSKLQSSDVKP